MYFLYMFAIMGKVRRPGTIDVLYPAESKAVALSKSTSAVRATSAPAVLLESEAALMNVPIERSSNNKKELSNFMLITLELIFCKVEKGRQMENVRANEQWSMRKGDKWLLMLVEAKDLSRLFIF